VIYQTGQGDPRVAAPIQIFQILVGEAAYRLQRISENIHIGAI
jgi:hypothetical protein